MPSLTPKFARASGGRRIGPAHIPLSEVANSGACSGSVGSGKGDPASAGGGLLGGLAALVGRAAGGGGRWG